LHVLDAPAAGVGAARRLGMDVACGRLPLDGLIACTDADSEPAPDWLAVQLAAVGAGAAAIGGRVQLPEHELQALPPAARERRAAEAQARLARARADAHPAAQTEHWQFSGASMALTAGTYAQIGPLEPRAGLEDEGFERQLRRGGIPIDRLATVRVTTSGREHGRAPRGLAVDLRRTRWLASNRFRGADYAAAALAERKRATVSLVLPTREVAGTIGRVLDAIAPLERAGLVDEVLVVDAASRDGTAQLAARRGARVEDESALLPEFGPALGKGDAMWRGLAATSGQIVAYLDTDTEDFHAGFVTGLLGPLIADPQLAFVKASFRRPLRVGDTVIPDGGGRVTELVARPFLNLHVPAAAGFLQPLAGEVAARRDLLERLSFPVGYGVEIAMLIDALGIVGLERMAQVDLGTRQNRHQPLAELSAMALAVLAAAERRVHGPEHVDAAAPGPLLVPHGGELVARSVVVDERPPLATLAARLAG
ncbi:MAG: glucosyl-3-phosphoglycerate synthase, partial [Solirubrobacteraceae bacterium]|nr:glucosyl-3-phosphoglycerate synthase [Solirubrobacteraceae bacterium]